MVIMGGAHATMEYRSILQSSAVDGVVIGEGEYVFRDIVRAVAEGLVDKANKIPGTVWKVGERMINNGYPGPISDINGIPLPAYGLLPMERYIWQSNANFAASMRWPIGHMLTSRGCLYNCRFCSSKKRYKKFRNRNVDSIIEEIELLIRSYHIREFHFHDDCFMSDPKQIREICSAIIRKKIDIKWQVSQGINSVRLDEDLLELMYQSGMYRVGFPIESGCDEILRFIRKPINLNKTLKLIEKCNYLGIYTFGCFMIGFPDENREKIDRTIHFLLDSGLDYVKISIVQPIPGSELYSDFKEAGLLKGGIQAGSTYFNTEYDTLHLTKEELNGLRAVTVRRFARKRMTRMLKPSGLKRFLLPKIKSKESLIYFLRMAWHALRGL
jgi:anaerobic magnesium-protoporphyrin IX monomethyl ester cyclase